MATTRAARHFLAALLLTATAQAGAACGDEPRLHALDFWLGRWNVTAGGGPSGSNEIDAILGGCAVAEHWLDVQGNAGLSLFWFDRNADRWKQVWVTAQALESGGAKEKMEVRDLTTLTREAPDRVRQLIEISKDGGRSWLAVFDAEYRRVN